MTTKRQLKLGLSCRYLGYHVAAWRHPDVPAGGAIRFEHFLDVTRKAEAEKIDMIFFADSVGVRDENLPAGSAARSMKNAELEPITLLAALASCTTNIGLVTTASTSYNEPFHIARKYASLDHISHGRAGWNVVTSWSEQEAWNFNRDEHIDYDTRYAMADEFVDVVTGLWDSWEPDAFLHDKHSGLFYDEKKLHVLNHVGKFYKVRGPLNSARTPQGRPIIVQAGASPQGRDIGARAADVIYSSAFSLEKAQAYYADMKARAVAYGRNPDELLIMPGVTFYIDETLEKAQAKQKAMEALIDPLIGLSIIHHSFGDLTDCDIDGPVPEPKNAKVRSIADNLYEMAQEKNMSIRDLYLAVAAGNSGWTIVGTPETIVNELEAWLTKGGADGFNICPATLPGGMDDVSRFLLPELRSRGLFRSDYEGRTLRDNLGLPMPVFGDVRDRHRYRAAAE
jgi:FMN-dependent oxidoreductase (nitrilotriacetate monooxygenase family)